MPRVAHTTPLFTRDYDSAFALGADEVRPEVDKARRFVEDARAILHAAGWIG